MSFDFLESVYKTTDHFLFPGHPNIFFLISITKHHACSRLMIKASQVTLWRTITSRIQSRLSEQQTTATTKPVSRLYTIVVRLQLMIHTRRVGKYKFSFSFTLMYQIEFELRSHTHTPIDWGLDIWAHCVTVYTRAGSCWINMNNLVVFLWVGGAA
jgi:hypothetical protein